MQHVRVASEAPAGLKHAHGTGLIVSVGKTDMHPKLTEMLQHAEDPTDRKALQQALGVLDDIFIGLHRWQPSQQFPSTLARCRTGTKGLSNIHTVR